MARKDIMLAMPYDRKRVRKWGRDFYVQPKLDGIRCRALIQANKVTLVSSQGNEIVSVPHLNAQLLQWHYSFRNLTPHIIESDGELYRHNMKFEDIVSVCRRTVNKHPDYAEM